MQHDFLNWFNTFLEEKGLLYKLYQIEVDGNTHFIDSELIIDLIKKAPYQEQSQIKNVIVMIDFKNGDVHHFFEHLATGYIKSNYKSA